MKKNQVYCLLFTILFIEYNFVLPAVGKGILFYSVSFVSAND